MAAAQVGISYSDFLQMSPAELQAYSDGYQRRKNYEAWLFGVYVQNAIASCISASFSKGRQNAFQYPGTPIPSLQPRTESEVKAEAEKERMRAYLYLNQFVRAGKNWGPPSEKDIKRERQIMKGEK